MPYYIRVLSPSDKAVSVSDLSRSWGGGSLVVEEGTDDHWKQILLVNSDSREVAVVERNTTVESGSLGHEELGEFIDEVATLGPASNAKWLSDYLYTIKVIYAFKILGPTTDSDWEVIGSLKARLWNVVGGILQADGEGFSNEDGYHIVWQFSESASGPWWMGLLDQGNWVHFQMELSNHAHRDQFLAGNVPQGLRSER